MKLNLNRVMRTMESQMARMRRGRVNCYSLQVLSIVLPNDRLGSSAILLTFIAIEDAGHIGGNEHSGSLEEMQTMPWISG